MMNLSKIRTIGQIKSQFNYWIIVVLSPYFWPLVSKLLRLASHSSKFVPPNSRGIQHAVLLVSNLEATSRVQVKGIDLSDAVENWLKQTLKLESVQKVLNLDQIHEVPNKAILVVSYDWLAAGNGWRGCFREIRRLAYQARRLKLPVWVMLGDTFDPEYTIPSSLLVSMTGGATILQCNTKAEGDIFGLVFSSGPHVWTMPRKNLEAFSSSVPWASREKSALIALSGEPRRKAFMSIIASRLEEQNWKIIGTSHQLTWEQYVEQTKNAQVSITTCWLQQQYLVGTSKFKKRIAKTTVTHRVWEGFAAGCVVVTNSNSVLDSLGFKPGVHFIELWDENGPKGDIQLREWNNLEKIANSGHELFSRLVFDKN